MKKKRADLVFGNLPRPQPTFLARRTCAMDHLASGLRTESEDLYALANNLHDLVAEIEARVGKKFRAKLDAAAHQVGGQRGKEEEKEKKEEEEESKAGKRKRDWHAL